MLRVIEDLGRAAALHDLAAVEHDGLIGELTHDGQVVTDQDVGDGRPVRDELPMASDDDIFEAVLAIMITGLCERAPQLCTAAPIPLVPRPDSP